MEKNILSPIAIFDDDGFSATEVLVMPSICDSMGKQEVEKYFDHKYAVPPPCSIYDCSGKIFTLWAEAIKKNKEGHWVFHHRVCVDC